jgi:hypothetical protein
MLDYGRLRKQQVCAEVTVLPMPMPIVDVKGAGVVHSSHLFGLCCWSYLLLGAQRSAAKVRNDVMAGGLGEAWLGSATKQSVKSAATSPRRSRPPPGLWYNAEMPKRTLPLLPL